MWASVLVPVANNIVHKNVPKTHVESIKLLNSQVNLSSQKRPLQVLKKCGENDLLR